MIKRLASQSELQSLRFKQVVEQVNKVAACSGGLQEYTTYSRIWEYPWVWLHLESLKGRRLKVLDVGSERSPFPWFLATQGFNVIVSDVTANHWRVWQRASRRLGVTVRKLILDAQDLNFSTASVDVYLSVSVIEHVPNKAQVLAEAARVLRPGGLLIMTFDICEPNMGMTFPEWNGQALTMREFDDLFKNSPWFESELSELPWNTDDIPEYLSWHRTTAPHHNYVTGAAVVRRNDRIWTEPAWKDHLRTLRGKIHTVSSVAVWHLQHSPKAVRRKVARLIKSAVRRRMSLLTSPRTALLFGEPFFWLLGLRRKSRKIDLLQIKRVLVVRLDEIGDVVMTTPFLRELHRNLPDAWITLVVKPAVYNLVELCPYVKEVLTYDWRVRGRFTSLRRHGKALGLAWRHLWQRRFDLAILPRWDADYYHGTFLIYFSGASWRIGYSENTTAHKKCVNKGFDRLLTHALDDSTLKHEVEHNLEVIRFLGGRVQEQQLELWVSQEDENFAESIFREYGVQPGELVVGFGPSGGNSPLKQWPVSNFIELGRWLRRKYSSRILLIGGPGEEALGWEIEHGLGSVAINVVGKTTLRQMAALLKRCHLYVGNDAGPMHVAAAMGTPIVALFGPSCHHRFGPWGKGYTVLWLALRCSPCFQVDHSHRCGHCLFDHPHCILGITVEQVKRAVAGQFRQLQAPAEQARTAQVK